MADCCANDLSDRCTVLSTNAVADERRRHCPADQRADCSAFSGADAADEQPDGGTNRFAVGIPNVISDTISDTVPDSAPNFSPNSSSDRKPDTIAHLCPKRFFPRVFDNQRKFGRFASEL